MRSASVHVTYRQGTIPSLQMKVTPSSKQNYTSFCEMLRTVAACPPHHFSSRRYLGKLAASLRWSSHVPQTKTKNQVSISRESKALSKTLAPSPALRRCVIRPFDGQSSSDQHLKIGHRLPRIATTSSLNFMVLNKKNKMFTSYKRYLTDARICTAWTSRRLANKQTVSKHRSLL
jgi:hypothetical protein